MPARQQQQQPPATESSVSQQQSSATWLLLIGCTCPEGGLVLFASTTLTLLAHEMQWPAATLGLYNSAWGIASGVCSLVLWPALLASGRVGDVAALHVGAASLGAASGLLAYQPSEWTLWAVLPLGVVAVGLIRTLPAALLTNGTRSPTRPSARSSERSSFSSGVSMPNASVAVPALSFRASPARS